jgi:hypothetical protein
LLFLLLPGTSLASLHIDVKVRRLRVLTTLEERPYAPIILEGRLVIPDSRKGQWGVAFFDLDTDLPPRFEQVRSADVGFNPLRAGFGRATWWIWTMERRWLILDGEMKQRGSTDGLFATPVHPPVVLGDRAVVYGFARAEVTGTGDAYLYELTAEGECVPILEFSPTADHDRLGLEFQWDGKLAGGLGRSPDGSFAFLDPRSYKIYLFDKSVRMTKVIQGAHPRWRPPNWSGAELKPANPSVQGDWWRWALSQIAPKAPVFLDERHIAVLVGIPKAGGSGQSLELDIYRTDGTTVATAIPIPDIHAAGRLFVAQRSDPQPGDDIVIIFEPDLPPYLESKRRPSELWSITVTIGETEAPEKQLTGMDGE